MKVERKAQEKRFEQFSIIVETQEEARFLYGIFNSSVGTNKEDCSCYEFILDVGFFNAINDELTKQGIRKK